MISDYDIFTIICNCNIYAITNYDNGNMLHVFKKDVTCFVKNSISYLGTAIGFLKLIFPNVYGHQDRLKNKI